MARSEVDVLDQLSDEAWAWLEGTVADVTAEQANWWPPGTANSIGATYLHVVINADVEVSQLLLHRPPLIEQKWNGDAGQGTPYDPAYFDRWHRGVEVDWPRLREYGVSVHTAFTDWRRELTAEQLEQPIDMTRADLGMWEGRDLLVLHGFNHVYIHGGEIAVLKGVQGGVGWAQSDAFANPCPFHPDRSDVCPPEP